jgi:serine/threonine protein kinase
MLILEQLSHPHIVRYFGGGRAANQLFYAMEAVDGGTLKGLLQQSGRLSWQEVATTGIQLCSALQAAHNHGIIHRDLKPANLFYTPDGDLKLGDFGIARDTKSAEITASGLTVGTHAYMSPEQITGDRTISGKTDLYALGCLLFEMLTARPPFEGENFAQLFDQHLRRPPPRVRDIEPGCPIELDEVICQLLEKSPEDRPFNARTVQARLMRLVDRSIDGEDAPDDVSADNALDHGRRVLSWRLSQVRDLRESRDVSWLSLACVLLAVVGVVWAAWHFGI